MSLLPMGSVTGTISLLLLVPSFVISNLGIDPLGDGYNRLHHTHSNSDGSGCGTGLRRILRFNPGLTGNRCGEPLVTSAMGVGDSGGPGVLRLG